jgi:energy-coupling factor transport system ATP-binding protein
MINIFIQELDFTYPGDVHALQGIHLTIRGGEKVAIVGQNGAGKTTLVRHFNGLLKPTHGSVRIGDWDTRDHTIAEMAARVGYVFQNPDDQLFSRSVLDEITFGPKNLKYSADKVRDQVAQSIKLTELSSKESTNPYDLSPAWRKMVALASIIAMDTPILILDEPTTGQDAVNIQRIANIIQQLHQQGKTILTITHDIDFCAENFDRIIVMGGGKILLDGPTAEIVSQTDILAQTYVDAPQLTRLGRLLDLPQTVTTTSNFLTTLQKKLGQSS